MITTALVASVLVAIVGSLILWSNPTRGVNRAVFTGALQTALWLACWHIAATNRQHGLFWLKWTCAIGALAPLSFWLVKESILTPAPGLRLNALRRGSIWLIASGILAIIPFTELFIPSHSTAALRVYGWGYYVYIWGILALYFALFIEAFTRLEGLAGARRLELQLWLCGGTVMASSIYVLMGLSTLTRDPIYRKLEPIAVLLFYTGAAIAITTARIFDARQILLVTLQKVILVSTIAALAFGLDYVIQIVLAEPFAFLVTTAVSLACAVSLSSWLDGVFRFYPQATMVRQAAFDVARRESRLDKLNQAFLEILKGWGQSDHAVLLFGGRNSIRGAGVELDEDGLVAKAMKQLRWATPERLARERATPERRAVIQFLSDNQLHALVLEEGPALTVLVGVGIAASRRPFTYPQITQLIELASIIDSALERAHFSAKVQHAEQLATVGLLGASLAHEIRNPLVSIKTFVQLLPTHHQDPRFRDKFFKLIGDEVGRIDQLTEQLLDLASPRTYQPTTVELHAVLHSSLDLVSAKAAHRNIQFVTEFQAVPDTAYTDASAAKQVMLNLCFNAIQAVDSIATESRWVKIATQNTQGGIEMAIADSGPGISPEIRPKLFQPFQTTKSTGFGLGLAICSDILANLNASISVDPPVPGCGATFRVTFPCQPS